MHTETARFILELRQVGGSANSFASDEEAVQYLLEFLRSRGIRRVLMAPSPLLEELHLTKVLNSAGVEVLSGVVKGVEVGITGALAAVADSGTLLLGGTDKAWDWQWASLLPSWHIVLLRADQIRLDLESAFQDLKKFSAQGYRGFVWITGPSRTADIAATPLLGMHGPAELHVLILP